MLDNPAGRLRALMEEAKSISADVKRLRAWRTLLCPEDENAPTSAVLSRLAEMMQLPAAIRSAVDASDADDAYRELLLKDLPDWEKAFGNALLQFDGLWATFLTQFSLHHYRSLEHLDLYLSRHKGGESISEEDLDDLLIKTGDLAADVRTSALDDDVKHFLLQNLERIRHALEVYRISGTEAMVDAFESVMGSLTIEHMQGKPRLSRVEDSPLRQRFNGVVHSLYRLVHFAYMGRQLSAAAVPALEEAIERVTGS